MPGSGDYICISSPLPPPTRSQTRSGYPAQSDSANVNTAIIHLQSTSNPLRSVISLTTYHSPGEPRQGVPEKAEPAAALGHCRSWLSDLRGTHTRPRAQPGSAGSRNTYQVVKVHQNHSEDRHDGTTTIPGILKPLTRPRIVLFRSIHYADREL